MDQTIDMIEKEFQKIHDQNREQQLVPNESTPLKNEDKMRYEKVIDSCLISVAVELFNSIFLTWIQIKYLI